MPDPSRLAVAGPPCSGKTAVGGELARITGAVFIDLDASIAEIHGLSPAGIIEESGEARFREMEAAALESALARRGPVVLALGGGTLLDPSNMELVLREAVIVTLDVREEILRSRLTPGSRPLSPDPEALGRLLEARHDHYRSLPNRIDCSDMTVEECAVAILAMLYRGGS